MWNNCSGNPKLIPGQQVNLRHCWDYEVLVVKVEEGFVTVRSPIRDHRMTVQRFWDTFRLV